MRKPWPSPPAPSLGLPFPGCFDHSGGSDRNPYPYCVSRQEGGAGGWILRAYQAVERAFPDLIETLLEKNDLVDHGYAVGICKVHPGEEGDPLPSRGNEKPYGHVDRKAVPVGRGDRNDSALGDGDMLNAASSCRVELPVGYHLLRLGSRQSDKQLRIIRTEKRTDIPEDIDRRPARNLRTGSRILPDHLAG